MYFEEKCNIQFEELFFFQIKSPACHVIYLIITQYRIRKLNILFFMEIAPIKTMFRSDKFSFGKICLLVVIIFMK